MDILMVASEVAPFAKTGGLADMVGSLSKKMEKQGHNIKVILPYYRMVKEGNFEIDSLGKTLRIKVADKTVVGEIMTARMGRNITVWFIKSDDYYAYEGLYGTEKGDYEDNAERFIFFCKATLDLIKAMAFKPDIIHCHDWQTGLIPAYLKTIFKSDPYFANTKTVFTIHNLAYQGVFPKSDMPLTGLPWEVFTPERIEFYGKINFLKAGIVYSDLVGTVSERYSQEIQTKEYGCGLEGVLRSRKEDLYGIMNGLDFEEWDPETDRFIIKNYSRTDLSNKKDCKRNLLEEFGIRLEEDAPLFGLVSRLVDQKGIGLVVEAANEITRLGGLVILGKGDEDYEKLIAGMINRYPDKVGVRVGFDEPLAHRITAGCDFFLIPSRYEPCGLNAIYSLKYGTVPIVRATGGLDEIISEFNLDTGKGNGFKFYKHSKDQFLTGIKTAIEAYKRKKLWHKLLDNTLRSDHSWKRRAMEYEELYIRVLRRLHTRRSKGSHLRRQILGNWAQNEI